MITKLMKEGNALTPEEMKEVKGGANLLANRLWRCLVEGIQTNVCYSIEPSVPCNYVTPCTEIGTCPGQSLCVQ